MSTNNYTSGELLDLINNNITTYLIREEKYTSILNDAEVYSLTSGGKRLRPLLLLGAVRMCGGDIDDALPFACALEYIHTYSLIHDDLPEMDNDDYRRGVPTNHKVYGSAIAMLAGDALLTTAFEIMCSSLAHNTTEGKALAAQTLANGANNMVLGQVADIRSGKTVQKDLLKFIDNNKTGALIKAAVLCGGYLSGANKKTIDDLTKYGEKFGLAFQIADDIADIEKDEGANYAQIYGIEKARETVINSLDSAIKAISKYDNNETLMELALMIKETV